MENTRAFKIALQMIIFLSLGASQTLRAQQGAPAEPLHAKAEDPEYQVGPRGEQSIDRDPEVGMIHGITRNRPSQPSRRSSADDLAPRFSEPATAPCPKNLTQIHTGDDLYPAQGLQLPKALARRSRSKAATAKKPAGASLSERSREAGESFKTAGQSML